MFYRSLHMPSQCESHSPFSGDEKTNRNHKRDHVAPNLQAMAPPRGANSCDWEYPQFVDSGYKYRKTWRVFTFICTYTNKTIIKKQILILRCASTLCLSTKKAKSEWPANDCLAGRMNSKNAPCITMHEIEFQPPFCLNANLISLEGQHWSGPNHSIEM